VPSAKPLSLLGVRIDDVTLTEAVERVGYWVRDGQSAQIATVNPEFVMRARHDAAFCDALARSRLNVPDGVGIMWAARHLGQPLRERVTGVALTDALCARAAERGWRVFLLGAADGVAARAAQVYQTRHPGLIVAGTHAGTPDARDAADIVTRIEAARPQLLFVAYGAPAQDLWLATHLPAFKTELIGMGIGGTLDYVAGVQPFAPAWVRKMGLEWLYRLIRQPSRWRRQLNLIRFMVAVLSARGGG
jgi:N-acetylglucosaminyldiphosphoundecaprenol N-acetyl-beta-D-mannosaminyltransferase